MTVVWTIAADPSVVHRLLEDSDRAAAARSGSIAPTRRWSSTQQLVAAGLVHVGTDGGRVVATVTVGPTPTFAVDETRLTAAPNPWYVQRLAVAPDAPALVGLQALRRAIETARASGADAVRAEANPAIADVVALLEAHGFVRAPWMPGADPNRIHLQRSLMPR